MKWQADKHWADRYYLHAVRVLAPHLIKPAPPDKDMHEATDLIILSATPFPVAWRVRRMSSIRNKRYLDEFTVRASRPSGAATELAKLREGYARYFLYGWAEDCFDEMSAWTLLDLDIFRQVLDEYPNMTRNRITNRDGTTFCAFQLSQFPPEMVLDRQSVIPHQGAFS